MAGGPDTGSNCLPYSGLHFFTTTGAQRLFLLLLTGLHKNKKKLKGQEEGEYQNLSRFYLWHSVFAEYQERPLKRCGIFSLCHKGSVIWSDFFRGGLHVKDLQMIRRHITVDSIYANQGILQHFSLNVLILKPWKTGQFAVSAVRSGNCILSQASWASSSLLFFSLYPMTSFANHLWSPHNAFTWWSRMFQQGKM